MSIACQSAPRPTDPIRRSAFRAIPCPAAARWPPRLAACATLGLRSKFAGVIGSDDNGTRVQEALVARGVDVTDAVVHHGPNQFAVILVDERTGERMVLWSRDDTIALRADELPPALLPSARVVHVDDVDQQAAIQVATLARTPGDRHERYRSRHGSNRRARRRGQHPDSGRARAGRPDR